MENFKCIIHTDINPINSILKKIYISKLLICTIKIPYIFVNNTPQNTA